MILEKDKVIIFILATYVLCMPITIFCETVKLKNGKIIESAITAKTANTIQMNVGGISITYYLDEIESIDGKPIAIPKVEQKGADTSQTPQITLPPIEIIEVGYELKPETRDVIKAQIIALWWVYQNQFGFKYPQDFTIKVRIFGNLDIFEEYQRGLNGKIISRTGFFWPKTREAAVWKNKNQSRMIDMILHEVSHLLLHSQFNNFPKWIEEGLSTFFEGMSIGENSIEIGWFRDEDAWCKHKVKYEKDFDIKTYFTMCDKRWDMINETSGARAYDVANYIIRFFMSTPSRREILKNILNYIKDNPDTWQSSVQAINLYYPEGIEQFDKDWRAWVIEPRKNISLSIE